MLTFEKLNGEGEKVSAQKIDNILGSINPRPHLNLVVLKACDSLTIGKAFLNYADYVICIMENKDVRDDVANMFTKEFYKYLCKRQPQNNIKMAFEKARESVENCLNQEDEGEA